ncbi:hypothetical protein KHA94_17700 [Bacillus sp. FJAT-49705]|uniref:DUF4179 domain-containing protein n=1 Tax=Cytobacillus citreus TaxID=2833586 RepID=A0ABS5NW97_9BACI|nr:hypothetical protein [Cytobacillus citreus]MBS4192001.1 hypothetical protein [Cytobacillus citreus]
MQEDKQIEIMNELKSLPKPVLQHHVQELILNEIQQFEFTYKRKKWWSMIMKRTVVSFVTGAAIIFLSLIGLEFYQDKSSLERNSTNSQQVIKDSKDSESIAISEKGEYYDSILKEHQVALDNLYVWIPERKETVVIDRKVKDGIVVVTIRDKDSNELLVTYGESFGEESQKTVYKEIQRDKVRIKLQADVEIDVKNNNIKQVLDTNLQFDPPVFNNENVRMFVHGNNATGLPPADNVTISAYMNGEWEDGLNREAFVIGVIPK